MSRLNQNLLIKCCFGNIIKAFSFSKIENRIIFFKS